MMKADGEKMKERENEIRREREREEKSVSTKKTEQKRFRDKKQIFSNVEEPIPNL